MVAPTVDQRILRGVAATLSWQNVDSDGTAAAPSGVVTVGVTTADGTVVVAAGTATTGTGTGPRTVALTAAQTADLNLLTVTWTDAGDSSTHSTLVEVVGGWYFSVAEARASDATLTDSTKYPDAAVLTARREVEEDFERICDVAFVPRYRREQVSSQCGEILLPTPLPRTVRSVRLYSDGTSYTALTASELADLRLDPTGLICGTLGTYDRVVVEWEHGHGKPPSALKTKALRYLRFRLNEALSAIPDRATSFSIDQGGTYRLDTASQWKVGVPDIDAELQRWSMRVPGIA
jgi:hypothetical protein